MAEPGDIIGGAGYAALGMQDGDTPPTEVGVDPTGTYVVGSRTHRIGCARVADGNNVWKTADPSPSILINDPNFSPDGSLVAVNWGGVQDMGLKVLDVASGAALWTIEPTAAAWFPSGQVFSPNGQLFGYHILEGGDHGWLRMETVGRSDGTLAHGVLWKHQQPGGAGLWPGVTVFSPNGDYVGYRDATGLIARRAADGTLLGVNIPGPTPRWRFAADSQRLVSATWTGPGRIDVVAIDVETGSSAGSFAMSFPEYAPVNDKGLLLSGDATTVAVIGNAGLWAFDVETGQRLGNSSGPTIAFESGAPTPSVTLSAGGRYAFVGTGTKVRLVDIREGRTVKEMSADRIGGRFTPDGRYAMVWGTGFSGTQQVYVLHVGDTANVGTVPGFPGTVCSTVRFPKPARYLAVMGADTRVAAVTTADPAGGDATVVAMYGVDDGAPVRTVPLRAIPAGLVAGGDGNWVAAAGVDGTIRRLRTTAAAGGDWAGSHAGRINGIAATAGLVVSGGGKSMSVFAAEPPPGAGLDRYPPSNKFDFTTVTVLSAAVMRDGTYAAVGCTDASVRVVSTVLGTDVRITNPGRTLRSLGFGGETGPRSVLVIGLDNGEAAVVDPYHGTQFASFPHAGPVKLLAVSADGTLVATSSGPVDANVYVWDVAAGSARDPIWSTAYTGNVTAVAFNPATGVLAVGTEAGRIDVTDPRNPAAHTFITLGPPVTELAFSADGTLLAALSERMLRVYRAS